ncbi:MAG: hypothetical protein AB7K71_14400 [Polyangiaceae bacterium]
MPVLTTKADSQPDDIRCAAAFLNEASVPHWIFTARSTQVTVKIPNDFEVRDVFEISQTGVVADPQGGFSLSGRTLSFDSVALGNDVPVRLYVIAKTAKQRTQAQQATTY